MSAALTDAAPDAVRHYLGRTGHILRRLGREDDPARLLSVRLAPDMFETGFNFAIAIQFAARALCPPAGRRVPEIPDAFGHADLVAYHVQVTELICPLSASDLQNTVTHTAGEAELTQEPAEYVLLFALPNMIFHLSIAYAGLRHGGMRIGKADFDGLHVY